MSSLAPCWVGMLPGGNRQLSDSAPRPKSLPSSSDLCMDRKAEAFPPLGDDEAASEDGMGLAITRLEQELSRLQTENDELRRVVEHASDAASRGNAAVAFAALAAVAKPERCSDGKADAGGTPRLGLSSASPILGGGAEGGLRAVLTSRVATSEQLRQAIGAVEALLSEAKRELAAKERRERRAAFEELHAAMADGDENTIPDAIAVAKRTGVEQEDISRAEEKLKELLSLTDQERAAKAAREQELKRKKQAFLLVKQNNAPALTALLDALPERVRWQDWRDHAGRTLLRFSEDLRALRAQTVVATRLGVKVSTFDQNVVGMDGVFEGSSKGAPKCTRANLWPTSASNAEQPVEGRHHVGDVEETGALAVVAAAEEAFEPPIAWSADKDSSPPDSPSHSRGYSISPQKPPAEMDEEERVKAKALRAVCQDDGVALVEVLETTPIEVVSGWQNRAGTDLLTLSEERGSAHAYSVLAKALGMVRETKRDEYEERETVWVFVQGDVQPRRATVLEDTSIEAETVLLEFWDGDDPPERVERSRIRRMWS